MARRKNSTNRTVARPKWSEAHHKSAKNVTKARVDLSPDLNVTEGLSKVVAHLKEFFGPVARRFKADAAYGRQHFNQEGFVHPDGALRLTNESALMMAGQIIEVLSQRAAMKGNKAFTEQIGEGGDPDAAARALAILKKLCSDRPGEIKKDGANEIYTKIMGDLGLDKEDLEAMKDAMKKGGKKPSSKAKSKAKATAAAS